MIQLRNTLTQSKETLTPLEPGRVGLYVCGVTVYDHCHIGHGRVMVVFDVLSRLLRHEGLKTFYVRNITDIDDKILERARDKGIPYERLTEEMIASFQGDMAWLGVQPPNVEPRATEHIQEMVALVERLLAKGVAYEAGGDVYFRVRSVPDFGVLSKKELDELIAGSRVEVNPKKRDPLDFVLWKAASDTDAGFPSPFGKGRPGWHIECSAMAMRYLGDLLDIHGGGEDLVFPHHENERAQTLAATGKPLANLWMHVGFVTMKDVKMSKSLGNTVYLRDLRASYHPEALRVALLSTHYRSPLDFSLELVENTGRALYRFYVARARQEARLRSGQGGKGRTKEARALKEEFLGSLKDDLNTPKAIGAIFKTLGLLQEKPGVDEETYQELLELYKEAGEILGAFGLEPYAFLERIESAFFKEKRLDQGTLQELVRARELARGQKDFRRADAIREQVKGYGVLLEDTPEGTLVRLDV